MRVCVYAAGGLPLFLETLASLITGESRTSNKAGIGKLASACMCEKAGIGK